MRTEKATAPQNSENKGTQLAHIAILKKKKRKKKLKRKFHSLVHQRFTSLIREADKYLDI
jgi:hypothetical protein